MRYSIKWRDGILLKVYGFLFFAKNIDKNIGKIISENLRGKCNQKIFNHDKQSATDTFKTASKRVIQKNAKATGDLIGNKIADEIIRELENFTTE